MYIHYMSTLFKKARVVVLANAHKLLDAIIDLDSVAALKQYIRDLEKSVAKMTEAAVQASGHVRAEKENLVRVQAQVDELNTSIEMLLTDDDDSNDDLAVSLEARLVAKEGELEVLSSSVVDGEKLESELNEALSKLKDKHESMISKLSALEAQARATEAKEAAADSLAAIAAMSGAETSVDDVAARMNRKKHVADARFERAMADVSSNVDKGVLKAKAEARIAERKKKLAAKKKPKKSAKKS
jgi:phage shock protein A